MQPQLSPERLKKTGGKCIGTWQTYLPSNCCNEPNKAFGDTKNNAGTWMMCGSWCRQTKLWPYDMEYIVGQERMLFLPLSHLLMHHMHCLTSQSFFFINQLITLQNLGGMMAECCLTQLRRRRSMCQKSLMWVVSTW